MNDEKYDDGPCCEHDDDEHGTDGCYHQERVSRGWTLCPCAQPRRDMTPTKRDAMVLLLTREESLDALRRGSCSSVEGCTRLAMSGTLLCAEHVLAAASVKA